MSNVLLEEDYLYLSGIQHFVFCSRQWALIHIEQSWRDNIFTFKGQQLHEKTNNPFISEKRGKVLVSRALPLVSHKLKLFGVADVVEFKRVEEDGIRIPNRRGLWQPSPVEYKVGRPKMTECDLVQLCAQAICLEEKFGVKIAKANMFYGKTRRRLEIEINTSLRVKTQTAVDEMYELFEKGITPPPEVRGACAKCSLVDLCLPKLARKQTVNSYLANALKSE